MDLVEKYATGEKLNLGCGMKPLPGWLNVDFNASVPADIHFDLRYSWPLGSNQYDSVLASHTLEHFSGEELFHIMYECGRVLKPGGHLIGIVPYATCETFYANPFHKQAWTERTPAQFDRRLYESGGGASSLHADQGIPLQPWDVKCVYLRPSIEWEGVSKEEFRRAARRYLNVVVEMSFVMKLVEE